MSKDELPGRLVVRQAHHERLLADIKAGKMPANPIIDSGVDVVTAANVDQYVIGWKALEKP